jgi:L-ascorbate metabolism protein UlaG (beta-lactamase superfamily)
MEYYFYLMLNGRKVHTKNEGWPLIHMMPEETVQVAIDVKAKVLMPVHWAKFKRSLHAWKEPIERLVKSALSKSVTTTTSKIGEPVLLNSNYPKGIGGRVLSETACFG